MININLQLKTETQFQKLILENEHELFYCILQLLPAIYINVCYSQWYLINAKIFEHFLNDGQGLHNNLPRHSTLLSSSI